MAIAADAIQPSFVAWFDALAARDDATLTALAGADAAAAAVAAASAWRTTADRPVAAVRAGGAVAVQTAFTGSASDGLLVELERVTVFQPAGDRLTAVAGMPPAPGALPAVRILREYFRAANEDDWAAFERCWAEDSELRAAGGPPRRGRSKVVEAYRRFLALFPRRDDRLERIVIAGRTATAEGRFLAENPHGTEIDFPWADVVELSADDPTIRRLDHWHDRDRFRALMELRPPPQRAASSPRS